MASVNWSQLQSAAAEASFDPVPPSTYDVYVHQAEATTSSTNKDMIKVVFKIENGPYAGKSIFNQFVLSPDNNNALSFFFRHMRALGLGQEFFAANPSMGQVASALQGRRARLNVGIRTWNEQEQNDVKAVLPPLGEGVAVPPANLAGMPQVAAARPVAASPSPSPAAAPVPSPAYVPPPAPPAPPVTAPAPAPVAAPPAPEPQVAAAVPPAPELGELPF